MADSQRKTANLYDGLFETGYYDGSGVLITEDTTGHTTTYIPITTIKTFTISNLWYNPAAMSNFAVYEWDENKQWLRRSSRQYPPASKTITFTVGNDCKYFTLQIQTNHPSNLMLNEGSTALPYQPYSATGWLHSLRKLTTATEAVENPLYSDGTAITNYTISGNTVQNGTPTPSNPVDVNGVGVRTENLWDENYTGITTAVTYKPIYVGSGTFTLSTNTPRTEGSVANLFLLTGNASSGGSTANNGVWSGQDRTVTATDGYVTIIYRDLDDVNPTDYNTMLNSGSTAKPYEPYGYKIPISSGQQTIDIYIGDLPLLKSLDGTAVDEISNGTLTRRVDSDGSVLPTPTTTQITMPSIPTTEGANSITVDTTVQPSEVTVNYKGWHNAKCKEYIYNMTIADWESASISQMENHTIQELQGGNWV